MRIPTLLALALSAAALAPAHAADNWTLAGVDNFYMHTPTPDSFTGLYRSQGMATDGKQWFFSWQYGLERANDNFDSVQRNSSLTLAGGLKPGIPAALMAQGLNHIGDIDYHNGVIYASLDSTAGYTKPHVALFNASDLSYTGKTYALGGTPANPDKDLASWVAVDVKRGVGYGKEWQNGNTINVYNLDDWSFSHTITLAAPLARIQGAKVIGDWLYMASDNDTQSIYRSNLLTGAVEEVLRLPQPLGDFEMEGLALREGANGALDMYIEQVVDPDRSGQSLTNPNLHLALYHYQMAPVPEPATYAMLLAGAGLLAMRRRRAGQA
ncbi:PEP-CTERM sorting domain-containing protein [Rugamonas sp. FT107W]|uniref:PEP-CTERM sorting domain-containing protein n=1 Tax=Duganella vulcania TaxID=2692166 RepID=A0A845HHR4_9BURK|nr:PEP-CTERM sorting domain-containing protein [Duganella vulcania]MYN18291.1 PEP-CTERM sorting domain-containing protein [Duganella vulcania]